MHLWEGNPRRADVYAENQRYSELLAGETDFVHWGFFRLLNRVLRDQRCEKRLQVYWAPQLGQELLLAFVGSREPLTGLTSEQALAVELNSTKYVDLGFEQEHILEREDPAFGEHSFGAFHGSLPMNDLACHLGRLAGSVLPIQLARIVEQDTVEFELPHAVHEVTVEDSDLQDDDGVLGLDAWSTMAACNRLLARLGDARRIFALELASGPGDAPSTYVTRFTTGDGLRSWIRAVATSAVEQDLQDIGASEQDDLSVREMVEERIQDYPFVLVE